MKAVCKPLAGLLVGGFLFAGLTWAGGSDEEVRSRFLEDARKLSTSIVSQVRSELFKEMERTGPVRSIVVCKYSAPEITASISRQTGMRVNRVALRPRNRSIGEADSWEQKNLLDFENKVARGEKAEALEVLDVVQEPAGRYLRYMRPIVMLPPCLTCHGPSATLSEAVKAQLAAEYPHDPNPGYQVGQVRGAISIKKNY